MTLSPIPRVLSTFRRRRVKALLMGGQACILYGAAEFSRDVDFAIAVSADNLDRLRSALKDLKAEPVFFPPLSVDALRRGHACHFRCLAPGLHEIRIDVMAKMRGADAFERLWKRRERLKIPGVGPLPVMSLQDLVRIKKTQRDKDWPMVRRLVESDMDRAPRPVPRTRLDFWLRECRTPELLCELAGGHPRAAGRIGRLRPAVRAARRLDLRAIERELAKEQARERELDQRYWQPLRAELERMRGDRRLDV